MKTRAVDTRRKVFIWVAGGVVALAGVIYWIASCNSSYFANVPPGYMGKVLTPSGWDSRTLGPGQVDLGGVGAGGAGNSLVLLEGVTTTVREKFEEAAAKEDNVDDRVLTRDGVPLTLTVYIRLTAPPDDPGRNSVFAQMTPQAAEGRVSIITLQDVYDRFAKMDVRNRIRAIAASYDNYKSLYANFDGADELINAAGRAGVSREPGPAGIPEGGHLQRQT